MIEPLLRQALHLLDQLLWGASQAGGLDQVWRNKPRFFWINETVMAIVQALVPHLRGSLIEPGHVAFPDGPGIFWRILTGFQMSGDQVMQPGDDGCATFGDDTFGGERFSRVQQHQGDHRRNLETCSTATAYTGCASLGIGQHTGYSASPRQTRH